MPLLKNVEMYIRQVFRCLRKKYRNYRKLSDSRINDLGEIKMNVLAYGAG